MMQPSARPWLSPHYLAVTPELDLTPFRPDRFPVPGVPSTRSTAEIPA